MFRVELQPTNSVVSLLDWSCLSVGVCCRLLLMSTSIFAQVLATISGKIRKNFVKVLVGDTVKVIASSIQT